MLVVGLHYAGLMNFLLLKKRVVHTQCAGLINVTPILQCNVLLVLSLPVHYLLVWYHKLECNIVLGHETPSSFELESSQRPFC